MNIFLNNSRQLRNTWWASIFFLVLALISFPFIMLSKVYHFKITISIQALIVIAATWICQVLRKKPLTELTGVINGLWIKNLIIGLCLGAALMILPALFLYVGGWLTWQISVTDMMTLLSAAGLFISVAVAEEFLFRGFVFQRLIDGIGIWGAQLIMAGYFLLIHMNNPGMSGSIKLFASVNIFLASIMFGLAFIKTKSLAMPIGLHFMANWVQGTLLGFGVSGNEETSLLKPIFYNAPQWLTGGSFGLEASVPGLICVIIAIIFLHRWKPAINQKKKTDADPA
jgi:hypothetical protein